MMSRVQRTLVGSIALTYSVDAFAYLDPGSGGILVSALFGVAVTAAYLLKGAYYKIANAMLAPFGRQLKAETRHGIVFFSEGPQYWNTFKPVIEALVARDVPVSYFTLSERDPGLRLDSDLFNGQYIGTGSPAYAFMNKIRADVCVMTTPGLDVFQIRRSPGVRHYAHLVHAPTTGTYKLFSFDYFDSVLCSGSHQIDNIRELEGRRLIKRKLLLETGCVYMDELASKLADASGKEPDAVGGASRQTVLVAPSWGENALLNRFGSGVIKPLLNLEYTVVVRPHPQSAISESELLEGVKTELGEHPNLRWDSNPDGFDALLAADVLISDLSGIVFDFAFVFEKPVVTVELELDLRGLDANHLKGGLWEAGMLDAIGANIPASQIERLPQVVSELLGRYDPMQLRDLRARHVYNYGKAGPVAAEQIQSIASQGP